MGLYQRWIVPRLIDLAMRTTACTHIAGGLLGAASGLVLEIGVGSGRNLPLSSAAVHHCAPGKQFWQAR